MTVLSVVSLAIKGDDVLKADTTLNKCLICHARKPRPIKNICHKSTDMAQCPLADRNVRLFVQILQSGSFAFKTQLLTSLPGKYRNGVAVAFCNFPVFP